MLSANATNAFAATPTIATAKSDQSVANFNTTQTFYLVLSRTKMITRSTSESKLSHLCIDRFEKWSENSEASPRKPNEANPVREADLSQLKHNRTLKRMKRKHCQEHSKRFSLRGRLLVCRVKFTTWNLKTLKTSLNSTRWRENLTESWKQIKTLLFNYNRTKLATKGTNK